MIIDDDFIEFLQDKFSELSEDEVDQLSWYWTYDGSYESNYFYDKIGYILNADWFAHGCSRIVYRFHEYPDYVIKVPFKGERAIDCESMQMFDDSDLNKLADYDELEYNEEKYDRNFCQREEDIYLDAKHEGLSGVFAQCQHVCFVNGLYLYAMEYCPEDYLYKDRYPRTEKTPKSIKTIREVSKSPLSKYNEVMDYINDLAAEYSAKYIIKLMEFVQNEGIDDLHFDNVRYDKNNKFKFIDYSGF